MGEHYEFKCPACRYTAVVSGGRDCGMQVATTTIVCLDCKALSDVATREMFAGPERSHLDLPLRCDVSARHKVKRWRSGGGCPRCGKRIAKGPLIRLWD
jgi:Zn finger protein HypA/HybF involved in hydrogenase expression